MNRRNFLRATGMTIGSAAVTPVAFASSMQNVAPMSPASGTLDSWAKVRADFLIDHSHIQMAQMLLASHPTKVREAISKHRKNLDENPALYWEEDRVHLTEMVLESAASYMGADPTEIGLTDSTTQGMSLLLNGFDLKPGEEVMATTHDHYITDMSIKYACKKKGATHKHIEEYADPSSVTVDEVVTNLKKAIGKKTRLVVVTWVHSCTGVKLPIRAISDMIADVNSKRSEKDRIYFMVDGVHGFGNQGEAASDLGCDFFAAGTHKWIFGPRGTGVVFAKKDVWHMVEPTIPPFRLNPFLEWLEVPTEGEVTFSENFCPGGFHAFEHRWALNEAFDFQMEIGRENVHARTTELNSRLKAGLGEVKNLKLHTPVDPKLSAGINCFEIGDRDPNTIVSDFHERGVVASSSPYKKSYARLTPCVINTEEEVDRCIEIVTEIAS